MHRPIKATNDDNALPFHIFATTQEKEVIKKVVSALPKAIKESIHSIYVQDKSYFQRRVLGHCHWSGKICLRRDVLNKKTIWHECGHAFLFDRTFTVEREWKKISGDVYKEYPTNTPFPHKGLLTRYSATNLHEDFAEYIEEIYAFLNGQFSWLAYIEKNDKKYLQKCALLYKYGAITKKDYERIVEKFFYE